MNLYDFLEKKKLELLNSRLPGVTIADDADKNILFTILLLDAQFVLKDIHILQCICIPHLTVNEYKVIYRDPQTRVYIHIDTKDSKHAFDSWILEKYNEFTSNDTGRY